MSSESPLINSLGSISIQNNEQKSIYDVNVSFLVNQYMDAPKDSYYIEELKAGDKEAIEAKTTKGSKDAD